MTEHYLIEGPKAPASGAGLLPAGLVRCRQCGEHNGRAIFAPPATAPKTWEVDVICRCRGIVCRHCRKGAIHRPCSYTYDERSGRVLRVAYFCFLARCEPCRERDGDGPIVFVDYRDEPGQAPEQLQMFGEVS